METRKIVTRVITTERFVYLIVTDPTAGRDRRYTVHRVGLYGHKSTEVIGREVPLGTAYDLIRGSITLRKPAKKATKKETRKFLFEK